MNHHIPRLLPFVSSTAFMPMLFSSHPFNFSHLLFNPWHAAWGIQVSIYPNLLTCGLIFQVDGFLLDTIILSPRCCTSTLSPVDSWTNEATNSWALLEDIVVGGTKTGSIKLLCCNTAHKASSAFYAAISLVHLFTRSFRLHILVSVWLLTRVSALYSPAFWRHAWSWSC